MSAIQQRMSRHNRKIFREKLILQSCHYKPSHRSMANHLNLHEYWSSATHQTERRIRPEFWERVC